MHVNQSVSPSYQAANRDQFPPSYGVQGVQPSTMGRVVGKVGPMVLRMSPSGVPTYYYYAPQQQQQHQHLLPAAVATSSPLVDRSSATPPPPMSPVTVASAPQSPNLATHHNHLHHRQLPTPPPPSNPFHFQQQAPHYGSLPSVAEQVSPPPLQHHSYGMPVLVQQSHCFFSPPASPSPPRTPPPSHTMALHHPHQRVLHPVPLPHSPSASQRQVTVPQQSTPQPLRYPTRANAASGTSAVAIDNKIEQAMDLVKSHLMFAVREEVEVLKEKIAELMERINQLEAENSILKANASTETLAQLGGGGQAQAS